MNTDFFVSICCICLKKSTLKMVEMATPCAPKGMWGMVAPQCNKTTTLVPQNPLSSWGPKIAFFCKYLLCLFDFVGVSVT